MFGNRVKRAHKLANRSTNLFKVVADSLETANLLLHEQVADDKTEAAELNRAVTDNSKTIVSNTSVLENLRKLVPTA